MTNELRATTQSILKYLDQKLVMDLSSFEERNQELILESVKQHTQSQTADVQERILLEFFGNGPLQPLIDDEDVTEVLVNGIDQIWYERMGSLHKYGDTFLSRETFRNFFERLFSESKSELTVNIPFADTTWLSHRVHLAAPPVAHDYMMCLRKKSRSNWTLERLQSLGWASHSNIQLLHSLVADRKSMVIVGGTSSGKTSVLDACLQNIGATERVVLVEDTRELRLPNTVSTNLVTRFDPRGLLQSVNLQDLVRNALRMRPDRIIMGEVRGPEAKDLLMALSTGHEGSMGTLHANSAQEALLRLEMLIQLGAPQWSLTAIRRLILLSVNCIVVVKRDSDGKRKMEGIYRISSVEDFGFLTEKISN